MKIYNLKLDNGENLSVNAPKLKYYNALLEAKTDSEIIAAIANIVDCDINYIYYNFTVNDAARFISDFPIWIQQEKETNPNLNRPYYPENGNKTYFQNNSSDKKIVSDYANISIPDIENLDIFTFWGFLHDAVVWNCNRTESGRKYLENAWMYMQNKPERNGLRELLGGGKKRGK